MNLIRKIISINIGLIGFTYSIPSLADPAPIALNGLTYYINFEDVTYPNITFTKENQPWWGDVELAKTFAGLAASASDQYLPNANSGCCGNSIGPSFIYEVGETVEIAYGARSSGNAALWSNPSDWNRSYAFVETTYSTVWVQPYAAMQHVGLDAINNQTALVLDNASECKNNGWNIDDGKYCVFASASNSTTDVYGDSTYGGYDTANFTSSYGVELNHDDNWTLGLAYGNGTSNFGAYNFSDTTASIESDNNFYSAYAVKQANENLKYSWLVGLSDHDHEGSRTYSGNTATSSYTSNGFAAAMDATWDKNVIGKKGRPYTFQPKLGLAYASHDQDGFSESGSGDLMTISKNSDESFLVKGGIDVSTQLIVNQGKNLFVPRLGLGYEMDMSSDWDTSDSIKAKLTSSTSDPTAVKAKTIGKNKGFLNFGADYYLTDRFMVDANASLKVTGEGSESSYGGGFSWFF